MTYPFHATSGLILIEAELSGPSGVIAGRFVPDTGATTTVVNTRLLRLIGYDPALVARSVRMATGSEVRPVARVTLNRFSALGRHAVGLGVLAHDLPPEVGVDGLSGLDSFRDAVLNLDFRRGLISLD